MLIIATKQVADPEFRAVFRQFDPDNATGTGLIDAFVRTQATGTEEGYNTEGAFEFDTKSGTFTHSLRLGDMLGFIPSGLFGGDETKFVYVYSKFGINDSSGGGFEEWAVGKGAPIIPEPATLCMLGIGALTLCPRRRR